MECVMVCPAFHWLVPVSLFVCLYCLSLNLTSCFLFCDLRKCSATCTGRILLTSRMLYALSFSISSFSSWACNNSQYQQLAYSCYTRGRLGKPTTASWDTSTTDIVTFIGVESLEQQPGYICTSTTGIVMLGVERKPGTTARIPQQLTKVH